MSLRPKPKSEHALVPGSGNGSHAEDDLLCDLEQQQTLSAENIKLLDQDHHELESLRTGIALLYNRSPIGYITFDKRGHIHNLNDSVAKFLGYERSHLLHLPLTLIAHPRDCRRMLDHIAQCEDKSSPRVMTDLRLRRKQRQSVQVQLVSVPFGLVNGQLVFLTAILDMAERARHERALAETGDFAEAIVETVRQPLAVLDRDLRIVSVNRAFTEFFKRPAQYISGRIFEVMLNLWWSGNELRSEMEKVLVKHEPLIDYRIQVDLADLGKRIVLVNARWLRQKENNPDHLLVSLEDITELESAREALRRINDELEERVAARTEALHRSYDQMEAFCYSIAHDLRAPLRSVNGFSQLLVEEFAGQISQSGKDYAQRIQQSAEYMDRLIQDLLSYGRLNTETLTVSDVDLEIVLQDVVTQFAEDIHEKRAKVRRKGRLPVLCAHPAVLHTVLANLISNGLKFVAPGLDPQIEVSAEDNEDWIRVWVADKGIGIAPEHLTKVFGVFQRLHSADAYPGTGIGLAIVAKGVERLGGRAGVESEPGKGSRFWFELPVRGGTPNEIARH